MKTQKSLEPSNLYRSGQKVQPLFLRWKVSFLHIIIHTEKRNSHRQRKCRGTQICTLKLRRINWTTRYHSWCDPVIARPDRNSKTEHHALANSFHSATASTKCLTPKWSAPSVGDLKQNPCKVCLALNPFLPPSLKSQSFLKITINFQWWVILFLNG